MCWMNLWSVNSAAYTKDFIQFTTDTLGTAPEPIDVRIDSTRIRPTSAVFTLTVNMCDCNAVIGSSDSEVCGEITLEAWLAWIHGMNAAIAYFSRLAVLHTWSADDSTVTPAHAKGIQIDQVTEQVLRSIGEDSLLTMDAPR